jgi:formylmethanofuran dehydrogenase subunit E
LEKEPFMMENTGIIAEGAVLPARLGQFTKGEFLERALSFHGCAAPGLVIGAVMVDLAMEQIPPSVLYDAICETFSCLPDAVQLLTPCTVGNGWLRVFDMGRYAVSLYDKYKGDGIRVYLDPEKMRRWEEIETWFFKRKPKREQDKERLLAQLWAANRNILTMQPVRIKPHYLNMRSKGVIAPCDACGEAYPIRDGITCLGCQGKAPYEVTPSLT